MYIHTYIGRYLPRLLTSVRCVRVVPWGTSKKGLPLGMGNGIRNTVITPQERIDTARSVKCKIRARA